MDSLTQAGGGEEEGGAEVVESRADMLARHQKEIKDLRNKEIALKKAAATGSKAQQKAKKKHAEEEMETLERELRARHEKELHSFEIPSEDATQESEMEGLVKDIAGISTSGRNQPGKPSKGQKWRERRAQQEAEREQRIKDEQNNIVNHRVIENQRLEGKLQPLGLTLREIKPDGHCLYRAIEDQLSLYPHLCLNHSFQDLRKIAAAYMRSHAEDLLPFIAAESAVTEQTRENLEAKFEKYCQDVESTVTWGGQLELGALAHSLRKHIIVFSADMPSVEMGKEYETEVSEDGSSSNPSLRLSYHRHAFGLGEHYNSVVPLDPSDIPG